jgi:single-strand DNA-binding protein
MVIGNLGQDPDTRYIPSGTAVTSFSVAVSEGWVDKTTGEQKERTEWINIEAWGPTAEACAKYLSKGAKVYVEGRLQTDSWDDKESGQKRYRTKVRADRVEFLSTRQGGGDSARSGPTPSQQAPGQPDFDDDIPF